jgi:hypothetical protein
MTTYRRRVCIGRIPRPDGSLPPVARDWVEQARRHEWPLVRVEWRQGRIVHSFYSEDADWLREAAAQVDRVAVRAQRERFFAKAGIRPLDDLWDRESEAVER